MDSRSKEVLSDLDAARHTELAASTSQDPPRLGPGLWQSCIRKADRAERRMTKGGRILRLKPARNLEGRANKQLVLAAQKQQLEEVEGQRWELVVSGQDQAVV